MTENTILELSSLTVDVETTTVEGSIECGFKTQWIEATSAETGFHAVLYGGAGLGNPYLQLAVTTPDGRTLHERIDARAMFEAWIDAATNRTTKGTE